jgi:hypothetical protein
MMGYMIYLMEVTYGGIKFLMEPAIFNWDLYVYCHQEFLFFSLYVACYSVLMTNKQIDVRFHENM